MQRVLGLEEHADGPASYRPAPSSGAALATTSHARYNGGITYPLEIFEEQAQKLGYGTLDNVEARKWYLESETRIPDFIDSSQPLEQQARQAFTLRNQIRTLTRKLMKDRDLAESLDNSDPNLSWNELCGIYYDRGFRGDDIYREIIKSAQRSRKSVNQLLGLED